MRLIILRRSVNLKSAISSVKRIFCSEKANETVVSSMRVLNVAEKNDAAKNLAEIMSKGRYRRKEGLSQYNKIYEYEYPLFNQRCTMIMTSVSGHLLNFDFVGNYRKWQACNPVALFDAPVSLECLPDYINIKKTLEREVRNCMVLIIWTDGDREGENIGFEIIKVCQDVKPNIQVYRARFSEITPQAVTRASQNLNQPNKAVSDAVNVRRELDLRIGAAFTRFQTLRLKRVFPEFLENQLISYGSCQFPTLGFVVERYKQVQAFVPEPFWKIKVSHTKNDVHADFNWKRVRLFDHTACLVLYQMCLENPTAVVIDIKSKHKTKWRPLPLDTVELEKLSSRKLHINAKETMRIAEKLYTQGFISYPRTETNIFPKELNLVPLVEMQIQNQNWGGFASRILTNGPNPRQGNKTDNAHPPIHPAKYFNGLQGNEGRIYELIVRHFLACVSKDAEGLETIVEIDINGEKFVLNGLMIIAKNYLEVYPYDKWNAKIVPEYTLGERFHPSAIEMVDGETRPPTLLTEADLIALMEKHGIGTDATHADHIETIKTRLYVGLNEEQRFVPGQLGMGLVEGYDMMGFEMSKPHLRAELEADLKRICDGVADPNVVLRRQLQKYQEVFLQTTRQANKIDEALSQYLGEAQDYTPNRHSDQYSPVMKCPKCNSSDIVLKAKKDGKGYFLSCMAYPQCNAVMWLPDCVEDVSVENSFCDECHPNQVKKLCFKFKRSSLSPLYPDNHVGCIGGCDRNFLEVLSIRPIVSTNASNVERNATSISHQSSTPDNNYCRTAVSSVNQVTVTDRLPLRSITSSVVAQNQRSFTATSANTQNTPPISNDIDVVCHCGESALLLTVRKEGPNSGRQFYKCPRQTGDKCNFFMWNESRACSYPSTEQGQRSQHNNGMHDNTTVICKCPAPAKLLKVMKEGPNTGRMFYTCPKPKEQGCNFFQWASDEPNNQHDISTFFSNGDSSFNQSQRRSLNSSETKKKRKCGVCGQEGHNRKNCPQLK